MRIYEELDDGCFPNSRPHQEECDCIEGQGLVGDVQWQVAPHHVAISIPRLLISGVGA